MKEHSSKEQPSLKDLYRDVPPEFSARMEKTLDNLSPTPARPRISRRWGLVLAALVLLTTACAGVLTHTEQFYRFFYGESVPLDGGQSIAQSFSLGDAVFTLDDASYADGTLYLTGVIRPKSDNIQLLSSEMEQTPDVLIGDSGYGDYPGRPEAQSNQTWGEYAQENGLTLLNVQMIPDRVTDADGNVLNEGSFGTAQLQKLDSIEVGMEIPLTADSDAYVLQIYCAVAPFDAQGEPDFSQRTAETWTVTIHMSE